MEILTIPQQSRRKFIILEHVLKSTLGVILGYAIPLFGPLLASAKSGSHNSNTAINVMGYFLERPFVQIMICLGFLIIFNLATIIKNLKKNRLNQILFNGDKQVFTFLLYSWYSNKIKEFKIDKSKLFIKNELKEFENGDKKRVVNFIKGKYGDRFTFIDFDNDYSFVEYKDVKKAIQQIENIKNG